jgi:hypothetical protein
MKFYLASYLKLLLYDFIQVSENVQVCLPLESNLDTRDILRTIDSGVILTGYTNGSRIYLLKQYNY